MRLALSISRLAWGFRADLSDVCAAARARFPLALALFDLKQTAEARTEIEVIRRETEITPMSCITWAG